MEGRYRKVEGRYREVEGRYREVEGRWRGDTGRWRGGTGRWKRGGREVEGKWKGGGREVEMRQDYTLQGGDYMKAEEGRLHEAVLSSSTSPCKGLTGGSALH